MGFTAFWERLSGQRVKEISPKQQPRQKQSPSAKQTASRPNDASWDAPHPVTTPKKAKRRSIWRAPPSPDLDNEPARPTTARHAKRRSLFGKSHAGQPDFEMYTVTANSGAAAPLLSPDVQRTQSDTKQNRMSVSSSKSVSRRKSRKNRLSFFGGRMDDEDSEDEIPAVPSLPAATARSYEHKDLGNKLGMGGASQDPIGHRTGEHSLSALPNAEQQKRRSQRLSMSNTLGRTKSNASKKSTRSQRRSWFHSSNPDDSEEVPAVPALAHDLPSPGTDDSDFERFLAKSHQDSIKAQPTDFEQFMRQSAMYESAKSGQHGGYSDGLRPTMGAQRRSYGGPRRAEQGFLKTSTETPAVVRHSWRHSRDAGPEIVGDGPICANDEQQKEWEKLKATISPAKKRESDHLMKMLQQMADDEKEDEPAHDEARGRKRESRTVYENRDALAALEFGVAK